MTKGAKTGLLTLLAVSVTGLALAAGAVTYLRSPSGSEFLLARAKRWFREQGSGELEYARGTVDLFGAIHFEKLRLKQVQGNRHLDVSVESLDFKYEIAWLARRLDVSQFKVEKPVIVFREVVEGAVGGPPATDPAPPADAENGVVRKEDGLAKARRLILNPPLQIKLPELLISGLDLDWERKSKSASGDLLQARVRGLSLRTTLEWVNGSFLSSGELRLGEAVPVAWAESAPDQSRSEAHATLSGTANWNAALRPQADTWVYALFPADINLLARDLSFESRGPQSLTRVRLPSLKLESSAKLMARTRELWVAEPGAFQESGGYGKLVAGRLSIEQRSPGKKPVLTVLASQEFNLRSELKEALEMKLSWQGRGLASGALLTRAADASAEWSAKLPRDLRSFEAQGRMELGGFPLLELASQARLARPQEGGGMELKGQLVSPLDARLFKLVRGVTALEQAGPIRSTLDFEIHAGGTPLTVIEAALNLRKVPVRETLAFSVIQAAGSRSQWRFKPISIQADLDRDPGAGRQSFRIKGSAPSIVTSSLKNPASIELSSEGSWTQDMSARLDLKVKQAEYGSWSLTADTLATGKGRAFEEKGSAVLTQLEAPGTFSTVIAKPITLVHRYSQKSGHAEGEVSAEAPHILVRGLGQVENTRFSAKLGAPEDASEDELALEINLTQGDFEFKQFPKLAGFTLSAQARLSAGNQFELESLDASFGQNLIRLEADAVGKLKSRDFEASGLLSLDVPKGFPSIDGQKLQGKMELPWTLSMVGGKELELQGTLKLKAFSVIGPQGGVSGVSGAIPLSEELILEGTQLRFARLITRNPFERVDFERVRPLLEGAEPVRIEAIHWEEKTHGPLIAFLSMEQNMLLAQQANLNLGSGRVFGEMFLDAYPANLQFGLLSRVTGLDLGEVLPKRFLERVPAGKRTVSGRTGVVVDINRQTISGRIDVTEIGAPQLVMMINLLDPTFQNERMNGLRDKLRLGHPTFVALSIEKGYADMTVGLSLLGSLRFPGVSISPWISSFTAALAKKTQEGPISQ